MSGGSRFYSAVVPWSVTVNGKVDSSGDYSVYFSDLWNFPSPRPYPHPLQPTGAQLSRVIGNTQVVTVRSVSGTTVIEKSGPVAYIYGSYPSRTEKSSSEPETGKLLAKAYRKFGSGPFNAATFLGEFHQSAHMIAKRANQIGAAASAVAKGDVRGLEQALGISLSRRSSARLRNSPVQNRLADNWLEYTYGWKPLVQDVYGALQAYQKGLTQGGRRISASSGGQPRPKTRLARSNDAVALNSKRLTSSAYVSGTVSNPLARSLNELGLLNPAALAWELLPFSFVADWFLPTGDILTALTAGIGISGLSACTTSESRTTTYFGPGIYQVTLGVDRKTVMGLADASFDYIDAGVDSYARAVTSVALLQQIFRR